MDKYDKMVEAFGLPFLLDFYGVSDSQVLRILHDEGEIDPEDLEFDEMEVNEDE